MNKEPLDYTKPVQTVSGIPVKIYTTEGYDPKYPVIGHIEGSDGTYEWTLGGKYSVLGGQNDRDLVQVPEVEAYYIGINDNLLTSRSSDASMWSSYDHNIELILHDGKVVDVKLITTSNVGRSK